MKQNVLIFFDFTRKLIKSRDMLRTMALRELKARYVGSLFGIFWAMLNPLFLVAIYGIIFGVFLGSRPDPVYGTENFFVYLICGLLPFLFLSESVNATARAIVGNRNLVKKAVGFPSEVLPLVTVISNLINHAIAMGVLLVIIVVFTGNISVFLPLIFVYMFFTAVFAVGLGWVVSSLNVYLRDVQQVLSLVMRAWFFFTPIFYSTSVIPERILPVMKLNPMYHVVDGYRFLLLTDRLPPLSNVITLFVLSFIVLGIGGVFFRKLKPGFAEVL